MASTTARVIVTKGSTALGIPKSDSRRSATFEEVAGRGVRVTELGHFGQGNVLWMAGSRKYLPPTSGGERYNLHAGDPTRYITITIQARSWGEVPRCKHGTHPNNPCGLCESED